MGQVRMHYAKLNKPGGERQILYGITYIWNLKKKKANFINRGTRMVTTRSWGGSREMGW